MRTLVAIGVVLGLVSTVLGHGYFEETGSLGGTRDCRGIAALPDGKILIAGGALHGAGMLEMRSEIYDPHSGSFSYGDSILAEREHHAMVALADGRVLLAGGVAPGGITLSSAEIYNPNTEEFEPTGDMNCARMYHTATLLLDGTVLVAGGAVDCNGSRAITCAELYHPDTGAFEVVGDMNSRRQNHTATLLSDGRVLITGGVPGTGNCGAGPGYDTGEIYDPNVRMFTLMGTAMSDGRQDHSATLLADGTVLVTGGVNSSYTGAAVLSSADIFDPGTDSFSPTGHMSEPRARFGIAGLPDGSAMVFGGQAGSYPFRPTDRAEAYDADSGSFTLICSRMVLARGYFGSATLQDGRILIAGGSGIHGGTASAELFVPCVDQCVWIDFGEVTQCQFVDGTEWQDLGVTISSPEGLVGWIANVSICPPSPECLTVGHQCPEHSTDGDFVITFSEFVEVTWVSVDIWDNDVTSPTEYIAFILSDGDSIAFPLVAGANTCVTYSYSDVIDHTPVARVRIEEDYPDVQFPPNDGVAIDNLCFARRAEVLAVIDIDPDVLNPRSHGRWITCYIELPEGYDPADIDVSTVMLNETVPAEMEPTEVGDYDSDGIPDRMVKFSRSAVIDILPSGEEVEVRVSGEVAGQLFADADIIRVLMPKLTYPNGGEVLEIGQECIITWEAAAGYHPEWYSAYYTADDCQSWNLIAENVEATDCVWIVPDAASVNCRVLVEACDSEGIMGHDMSDGNFTICGGAGPPVVDVIPSEFALHPFNPNPFSQGTVIGFDLPETHHVKITIHDVRGRLVRELADEIRPANSHSVLWNGKDGSGGDVAVGIYFVRLEAGRHRAMGKLVVVR
jgi:hypothetical protein